MKEEIICAGFGGQGIMLLGKLLAYCAMEEGKYITWMPSYGAEVRGGTAYSMTIISTDPIPSPVIGRPDSCIVMNSPSFKKFKKTLKQKGLLMVNSSMVKSAPKSKDFKIVKAPFTHTAYKLGNIRVANMVALGAYIQKSRIVKLKTALNGIEEFVKNKELAELNKKAITEGAKLVK
ncbi:MAG: 2-oxoacid:acceptor oxidoreductase family protein [Candidatus Omnitrophota bacterium]